MIGEYIVPLPIAYMHRYAYACRAREASALGRARRFRKEVGRRSEVGKLQTSAKISELPCSWDREFRVAEFVYTYAGPMLVLKFLRVEVFIPSFTYASPWRPQLSMAKCITDENWPQEA